MPPEPASGSRSKGHENPAASSSLDHGQGAHVAREHERSGVPILHTWRRVYWFVFAVFVAYVVLLTVFERVFR